MERGGGMKGASGEEEMVLSWGIGGKSTLDILGGEKKREGLGG